MEDALTTLRRGVEQSIAVKARLLEDNALLRRVLDAAEAIGDALVRGQRVLFAGNGGSAADAQHLAAELVSRLEFDRPGLPAQALTTDTSILTAIGNDYGYEHLFARQLQAQARAGDVFVGISTSGRSRNVLAAFAACRALGVRSIALAGEGGELDGRVDHLLRVPSSHTPRIQECHILLGHLMCTHVEQRLFAHLRR